MSHVGYINATILCGTCGYAMDLGKDNNPSYEPGFAIRWIVTCKNQVCPHLGIQYRVVPQVQLEGV